MELCAGLDSSVESPKRISLPWAGRQAAVSSSFRLCLPHSLPLTLLHFSFRPPPFFLATCVFLCSVYLESHSDSSLVLLFLCLLCLILLALQLLLSRHPPPHLSSEDAFPELSCLLSPPPQLPFQHDHRPYLGAVIAGPQNPDSVIPECPIR